MEQKSETSFARNLINGLSAAVWGSPENRKSKFFTTIIRPSNWAAIAAVMLVAFTYFKLTIWAATVDGMIILAMALAAAWPFSLTLMRVTGAWAGVAIREMMLRRYYDGKFANWSDVYRWVYVTSKEDLDKSLDRNFQWEPDLGNEGGFKTTDQKPSEGTP